jgi:hypothetical protein
MIFVVYGLKILHALEEHGKIRKREKIPFRERIKEYSAFCLLPSSFCLLPSILYCAITEFTRAKGTKIWEST